MSADQLLEEFSKLSEAERQLFLTKLGDWQNHGIDETSEMLAAIDEGRKSLREEGTIPIQTVIKEFKTWRTESR